MELNAYRIFLTVTEEMNFTRAAKKLFMTQQSLSGHIRRLEEHYGVRLFQRKPVLKLTPAGEDMILYARQMLDSEQAMTARFADLTQRSAGILRLGISHQRSSAFFPGIWSRYHCEYSNISVRLRDRLTNQLLDDLQNGSIDLMVGVDIPKVSNLTVIPLAQEQMRCVLNESLLREYFPEQWKDMLERYAEEGADLIELKELPMILLSSSNRFRQPIDQLFRRHNVVPHIALETTSHSLLFKVGCQGGGMALVNPLCLYEQITTQGPLHETCRSFRIRSLPQISVSLAYRSDLRQPQYILGMVDAIQEEFNYYTRFLERHSL